MGLLPATYNPHRGIVILLVVMVAIIQPASGQTSKPGQATPPPTAATGEPTSPQRVGDSMIEFSDAWLYKSESSDQETASLTNEDLSARFTYFQGPPGDPVPDPEEFIEGLEESAQVVASGTVEQATSWWLYAGKIGAHPYAVLATVNTADLRESVTYSVLLSPIGAMDLAVAAVQDGITIDGGGTPLQSIDPSGFAELLDDCQPVTGDTGPAASPAAIENGGATVNLGGQASPVASPKATPASGQTTKPGQATPPQTATTDQATSPQRVGYSTIEFSDAWRYEPSLPSIALLWNKDLSTTFVYVEGSRDTVSNPETALDLFFEWLWGDQFGVTERVVASGTVERVTSWRLYTGEGNAIPYAVLVTANTTDFPESVTYSALVSPASATEMAVTSVQDGITIDSGGTPLQSIDPTGFAELLDDCQPVTGDTGPAARPTEIENGSATPNLGGEPGREPRGNASHLGDEGRFAITLDYSHT